MSSSGLRLIKTKPAKQISGYYMIMHDMQFAARVFGLAAKIEERTAEQKINGYPTADEEFRLIQRLDPFLRAGVPIARIDSDNRNENETMRSALFEAGIIAYGRCFNSGLRTRLSPGKIFKGNLQTANKLHHSIMDVRNTHIAHSELKMERSIVGGQLVEDFNYGQRPNLIMLAQVIRRHVPNNKSLEELEIHCNSIVTEVVRPKILESSRALREELLRMTPEQLAKFPHFDTSVLDDADELL